MSPLELNENTQNSRETSVTVTRARLKISRAFRNASFIMCFQCALWYGGNSIIMPVRDSFGASTLPKTFDTMNIITAMYSSIPTQIHAVSTGEKNIPDITGITDHIAPQGTAHTTAIASILCPQLSITLVPQAPPAVYEMLVAAYGLYFPEGIGSSLRYLHFFLSVCYSFSLIRSYIFKPSPHFLMRSSFIPRCSYLEHLSLSSVSSIMRTPLRCASA